MLPAELLREYTLPLCGVLRWYNQHMADSKFSGKYYYTST
jgi:hypothetical protein